MLKLFMCPRYVNLKFLNLLIQSSLSNLHHFHHQRLDVDEDDHDQKLLHMGGRHRF